MKESIRDHIHPREAFRASPLGELRGEESTGRCPWPSLNTTGEQSVYITVPNTLPRVRNAKNSIYITKLPVLGTSFGSVKGGIGLSICI